MKYKWFRIKNFKGIKDTTINLEGIAGANVFAFVGLNESGKTTVLEAIHSFSPDPATAQLLGGETGVPFSDRVPRHLLSEFTGSVSVTAALSLSSKDKENIINDIHEQKKVIINKEKFPNEIIFEREQKFENGDFKISYFSLRTPIELKSEKKNKWRNYTREESTSLRDIIYSYTPNISYFPTFVFNFPERIYLTRRAGPVDQFYRQVFQDILDYDGRGHTISKDIVGRVRGENMTVPWLNFMTIWRELDDRDKIQHVMDRAGAAVTRLVFGRWNKIFGEDTKGKEVVVSFEIVEGEKRDKNGNITKTNEHDVVIKFQIRDGTRRFDVNDRSLGFRWFFSFMLFTQFRVARSSSLSPPLLFLFDEPAANLHAAAQQKLNESLPDIAQSEHMLAYSTHSHYMVEPKWLEQTFIVTNRADAPESNVLDEISLDDESLDIQATPYRNFVNRHPGKTSYFQPILDRLEVVPSRFDIQKASVVLEGKTDYYILRYAQRLLGTPDLPLLPGLGAGTFGALAALHAGWNLNLLFLLDSDRQGKMECARYSVEYGIPDRRLVTLDQLLPNAIMIEDLLDDEAKSIIQEKIGILSHPKKSQIGRFFQERLASDQTIDLGTVFAERTRALLDSLRVRLLATG